MKYIGLQNDLIAFVADTRAELENMPCVEFTEIKQVEFAEMYNGVIYTDKAECVAVKNENIRQIRANLYAEQVDTLHAQKNKDTIMGEWTDEKEQEYVAKVKELTIKIREDNPYIELPVDKQITSD